MSKRIGRNDSCPCGSGKKYKRCCLGKVSEKELIDGSSYYNRFLKDYDIGFLLAFFGALQLVPENHGKNIRLESVGLDLIRNIKSANSSKLPEFDTLKKFVYKHITDNYMEDPIEDFMTDRVIFINGNNTVFPGIQSDGAEILNNLLKVIFLRESNISKEIKEEISAHVILMLSLGNSMAKMGHLEPFTRGNDESDDLLVPDQNTTWTLLQAVTFSKKEIQAISDNLGIPRNTVESFVISEFDSSFEISDPNQNPLIRTPIVKLEDRYIFASPSNQVSSIIEYLYEKLTKESYINEVIIKYHESCWSEIQLLLQENSDWILTNLSDRVTFSENSPKLKSIWRIDHNKFCYAAYIGNPEVDQFWDLENPENHFQQTIKNNELIIESIEYDLKMIREVENITLDHILVLIVLGNTGRDAAIGLNKIGQPQDRSLVFGCYNLINILNDPKRLDHLTLWKFANAYFDASEKTQFFNYALIEAYVVYIRNNYSMFNSDDARPDHITIMADNATEFRMESKKFRNEHHAKIYRDGRVRGTYAFRRATFSEIYKTNYHHNEYHLLVEQLGFPLWASYLNVESRKHLKQINNFCEAVAFWMSKIASSIKVYFQEVVQNPIHIILDLDNRFLPNYERIEYPETPVISNVSYKVSNQFEIIIKIPFDMSFILQKSDNEGERIIMKQILSSLNELGVEYYSLESWADRIDKIIEDHMPRSNAKMLLFLDIQNNSKLDNRWLPASRYVQEHDISYVLDNLLVWSNQLSRTPEKIKTPEAKFDLCKKIVEGLYKQLSQRLSEFDTESLLYFFIDWNERCLHDKEFRSIQIPAKIACFSDLETELKDLQEKESLLVRTSLSLRCLIETIVADPVQNGSKMININDSDVVIALMDEIITWGSFGEIINLGIDNPEMGKLPSGRLGTEKGFIERAFKPFQKAKLESDIEDYINEFDEKFYSDKRDAESSSEEDGDVSLIDAAFTTDYGVSFIQIVKLFACLNEICQKNSCSSFKMTEAKIIETVMGMDDDLDESSIKIILEIQSIKNRGGFAKVPGGYGFNDIFPWVYNRRLSYIQRPLCKVVSADSTIYYYWGFRQLITSYQNTLYLIMSGKYRSSPGSKGALDSLIGRFRERNGIAFTRKVRSWFKENTDYLVIDFEVKIGPKGHLKNSIDLGDIDVCLFDKKEQIIYSLECKRTVQAKIVHEMKTEMDNYLGREGNPGMIEKHVNRHKWLLENASAVAGFLESETCKDVVSIVVTSEDIPVTYLAKEKLPLPFISFPKMMRYGISMDEYYVK